jgi:hypothetical protein
MVVHVSEESLDWALKHAENFGDTDVLPIPFEFKAIRYHWNTIKPVLLRADLDTTPVREHRRFIAPKGPYAYRVVTQIDPIDFLYFSALVYEIGEDLENARIRTDQQIVYSSRFKPEADGRMYDSNYNYSSFIKKCREFVDSDEFKYVIVADIADFFPRIYLHRIETALSTSTHSNNNVRAITKFLKGWHDKVSYGIPVGSAPSRLVAEITINDIDQYLVSEGTYYCRYSDDFRLFCHSKYEAYAKLESLAITLFENHGLFLQPAKTKILEKDEFREQYLQSHFTTELVSLRERFENILDKLGIGDPYQELNYENLPGEIQSEIDGLNLVDMLKEQLELDEINVSIFKFLLRRLGQINENIVVKQILTNVDKCYHLIPIIVKYLKTLKDQGRSLDEYVGLVTKLLNTSDTSQLVFNRLWWLTLFAENTMSISQRELMRMYHENRESAVNRKLILSLGQTNHAAWFRREKNNAMNLDPWSKRAFIAGASCLPRDECSVWYDSIMRRQDEIGQAIITWSRANPFS